jgi:hypothetical protein
MEWMPAGNPDEPRDQTAELPGGFWAEVGPGYPDGWTWLILTRDGEGNAIVEGSHTDSATDAKRAAETAANKIKGAGVISV